jgi:predicted RNA polymerase sigma factor
MSGSDAERTVRRIWKEEAPRVIGGLARLLRDVSLAEDFAQEAVLAALEEWPRTGIPDRPGAWLTTTARNRALNAHPPDAMAERTGAAQELEDGRQRRRARSRRRWPTAWTGTCATTCCACSSPPVIRFSRRKPG